MMKFLKHTLFAIALVVGLSMTATAQKKDDPPPKSKPPVIVPNPDKKPKEDKPKPDKKPQAAIFENRDETIFTIS